MLISKEKARRLRVVAKKLASLGFGEEKKLFDDLLSKFIELELERVKDVD